MEIEMKKKKRIEELIQIRKEMHLDDPNITNIWNELADLLSQNIDDTVKIISELSRDEVYWVSEVFEDISENLMSQEFINCIESLAKKYSDIDISDDIEFAKKLWKYKLNEL